MRARLERNLLRRAPSLPALAGVFVLLALMTGSPAAARHVKAPGTGLPGIFYNRPAPDFAYDSGAGAARLADLEGRPVVLNFWATWCEPCRAELPAFDRLRATYGNAVALLTITDEPPGQARAFLRDRHLDLPVVEDPERKIFGAYSITPIPVTLVLAPGGFVSYVSIGETSWDELQGAVASALISPARSTVQARSCSPYPNFPI